MLILPSCWFSLNSSETVKDITLEFCSIQSLFIRDISVKFGIPGSPSLHRYWAKLRRGCSDFRISGQSFINENCHNSRTNHDNNMNLGPVTKLDRKNRVTSKKFNIDVMSSNCDVIFFIPIYGQVAAIWKLDSQRMVYKTYISINSNLSSYKT